MASFATDSLTITLDKSLQCSVKNITKQVTGLGLGRFRQKLKYAVYGCIELKIREY